jgi:hypothetical protein
MEAPQIPAGGRRFTQLTEAEMTPRQREVHQSIVSGPRKGALGPFNALLRPPTACNESASTSASRASSRHRSTRWPS